MRSWTAFDFILMGIVAISTAASFFKGFTRELISLGAAIWGFILASWFYGGLAPVFVPYVKTPEIASLAAFLSILLAAMIVGGIASSLASRLVKKAGLRWFDRLLGGAFGLVRGGLLALAIVMGFVVFPPGTGVVERSILAPYLVYGARVLVAAAPAELRSRFGAGLERAQTIWHQQGLIK